MTIKVLKQQGLAIKAIAKETGLARNTVKKYLACDEAPSYKQRAKCVGKLDPYQQYIQSRIQAAHPDWIPAAVIYREIIERGYQGKIRTLSNYMSQFKPKAYSDPVVRFETEPGQQMQVDFTIIRRGPDALKAFVATLGHSRASYVYFYNHERTEAWIDGLERSFEFFGGVPSEILFDNAKTIIIERDAYAQGNHRWNPQLLSLAKEYSFKARVCRPYRAKTKGKVERFNRYLKSSFVVPLQATLRSAHLQLDVQTANAYIGSWLVNVANNRVHGTTGKIPNQELKMEQECLLPLPIKTGSVQIKYPNATAGQPIPVESLQHPLSIYDQYMQVQYAAI